MSAFNWIILEEICPKCRQHSEIVCQSHVCADYDGDETGRFHERKYKLNQKMSWWPEGHAKFNTWKQGTLIAPDHADNGVYECCYSKCCECHENLYVVLHFEELVPVNVLKVGLENEWPEEHYK